MLDAMTRDQLSEWLIARGVEDDDYREELINQYLGKTEDEMDEIYTAMHDEGYYK